MADLKNSRRTNYKATYVQLRSAVATGTTGAPTTAGPVAGKPGSPVIGHQRAIEKAAFVQSLEITPAELQSVAKKARTVAAKKALYAVGALIDDKTATSTLRNAPAFATIDSATLIDIAEGLVNDRELRATTITNRLASIVEAYREEKLQPAKGTRSAAPAPPAKDLRVDSLRTSLGLFIRREISQPLVPRRSRRENVATTASAGWITLDDSRVQPSVVAPPRSHGALIQVTAREALVWAEKSQPRLLAELLAVVEPLLVSRGLPIARVGHVQTLSDFIAQSAHYMNIPALKGKVAGFNARMHVEPVGNLHLERLEMYPVGIERGELVHSIPLTPQETVYVSHKEWAVSQREFEEIVQDYFEGYSEEGVAEKSDIAMATESQSKHATALSVGASLSASYASVTLSTSTSFNMSANDDESRKDSRSHSAAITKKASARTKKDHKVTFKTTAVTGSEDQSVRVISNPSSTEAMRVDYFQLARKWKVDLLRYGIRMTYDIVIPNPGSALATKVEQLQRLDAAINLPFSFTLQPSGITYDAAAGDPTSVSNYAEVAALYNAVVPPPPDPEKWVDIHREPPRVSDYENLHYESIDFQVDENYYIHDFSFHWSFARNEGETKSIFSVDGADIAQGLSELVGKSGKLSVNVTYQYVWNYLLRITFRCRPRHHVVEAWRLQVWNEIRQAAANEYDKSIEMKKDLRTQLTAEIGRYDALTLRRMEQEEIMQGVLRWIFGPGFELVPFDIASLFSEDSNDPDAKHVLDPNQLSIQEWARVMERGEFIKYVHNAIEWENVLYFTYPYFWDDTSLWSFKRFLYHPDPTHRVFLRSGAARVVLTIRPGFEASFTQLVETGAFNKLPGKHPYVTIAQEIQNFAHTNYRGFPPANPEDSVRPQLYLEQRRVWREMQYLVQLLEAYKVDPANNGLYPTTGQGFTALEKHRTAVNAANAQANAQALALDPMLKPSDLLPIYPTSVPTKDLWGHEYLYQFPGVTGDYDLVSHGANGVPGGIGKDADISANAEASLIATWFEYTPTSALDVGITMNPPNVTPPDVKPNIG